jgi:hypothetical protein
MDERQTIASAGLSGIKGHIDAKDCKFEESIPEKKLSLPETVTA